MGAKTERMGANLPGQDAEDIISKLLGEAGSDEFVQTIAKEKVLIRVRLENRRGHYVTIIDFADARDTKRLDIKGLARELKKKLAAGGTTRDGRIEIQGDHRHKVRKLLTEMGFKEDNILVDEGSLET